jgi:cytoplasmic tRNA 2-thiolation protein 1
MAKLCPGSDEGCGGTCASSVPVAEEEEGGCGSSNGRTAGGEMASMDRQLAQNEVAAENGLELEITSSSANGGAQNGSTPLPNGKKGRKGRGQPQPRRAPPKQVMGQCKKCGYLSSQDICKACMLLDGLNKNRPKNSIEVGYEEVRGDAELQDATEEVKKLRVAPG